MDTTHCDCNNYSTLWFSQNSHPFSAVGNAVGFCAHSPRRAQRPTPGPCGHPLPSPRGGPGPSLLPCYMVFEKPSLVPCNLAWPISWLKSDLLITPNPSSPTSWGRPLPHRHFGKTAGSGGWRAESSGAWRWRSYFFWSQGPKSWGRRPQGQQVKPGGTGEYLVF